MSKEEFKVLIKESLGDNYIRNFIEADEVMNVIENSLEIKKELTV